MRENIKAKISYKGLKIGLVLFLLDIIIFLIVPIFLCNENFYYRSVVKDMQKSKVNSISVGLRFDYENEDNFNINYNNDLTYYLTEVKKTSDFLLVKHNENAINYFSKEVVYCVDDQCSRFEIEFCLISSYYKNGEYYDPRTVLSVYKEIGNKAYIASKTIFLFILILDYIYITYIKRRNFKLCFKQIN